MMSATFMQVFPIDTLAPRASGDRALEESESS